VKKTADNGIPAINRAMQILDALAQGGPATIGDLAKGCALARSTVYRTVNTLCAHQAVERAPNDAYRLGPTLLRLARAVPRGLDLTAIARPILDALAAELGVSAKLSIVDGREALVIATSEAPGGYSITTQIGRRFPLHAGAASKLLFAFLPEDRRKVILSGRLEAFTSRTIVARAALIASLDHIRAAGLAEDDGEYADGVRAVAAPVLDAAANCIAAVSVPFVAGVDPARAARIRLAVAAAGKALSRQLGA
jgi:DNA-binding IclR family transcriptional regulator